MSNSPGKKIKDICLHLGDPYVIKVIDLENVIYRDLGNGFDIEVSGLDNQKKSIDATIYIWQRKNHLYIKETVTNINSIIDLKDMLGHLTIKYLNTDISDSNSV